ncbi:peptidoglycan-binding protein [Streptomyces verrucosisporus]|uniref:peptidoglycan-binding domain-containing protein n=1 Tax=Streptomyces verrucosisporus TaxID=1695161 RepID=UPI0019CFCCF4|nr:peptidoglycan-binding domain-containing protein [Streptomyces verrucosisporus]MBN3929985.1 peptidoglycan-binding protein [Streptomyces verrucosisporus]
MALRPDSRSRLRRPAAGEPRSLGPWDRPGPGAPQRSGDDASGSGDGAGARGTEAGGSRRGGPAGSSGPAAPPEPRTGFLTGRRGPRTTALALTTGAIGSALATLLVASGVLTPADPRPPLSGGPPPSPERTASAPDAPPSASGSPDPGLSAPAAPPSSPDGTPSAPAQPSRTPPESAAPPPGPASQQSRRPLPSMLREGDGGPEVEELQRRLRQIPGIYPGGEVDGRYDASVTEAVARYQQWYGIRGDEKGVYGDDTRRDLEART